ncbi:hypothetical protein [Peribacillus asahii]|uniref:hypothetical protein n=1 Tax=Peribacillus asahii TaxID=228899 RepID=UPI00207AC45F|nr:hypothetical protein [Peribacillus asahii]USK62430.1 hypothetical protein LIT37_23390 [Peribacillus asahii]
MKKAILGASFIALMAFGGNTFAAGPTEVKSVNTATSASKTMSMEDCMKMMKAMGISEKDCMKMMKDCMAMGMSAEDCMEMMKDCMAMGMSAKDCMKMMKDMQK